jgi:hypothetical protein
VSSAAHNNSAARLDLQCDNKLRDGLRELPPVRGFTRFVPTEHFARILYIAVHLPIPTEQVIFSAIGAKSFDIVQRIP